jgi:hypothetical protein
MAVPTVNKNTLDVSQIFQTYITFCGDAQKTAVACDVDVLTVKELARTENWDLKAAEWSKLRDGNPAEVQIQINRAVNYVQAHRARALLDKVIAFLSEGDASDLVNRLTINTKHGPEFKTRALTDLVKAMESCQLMTQRALGDNPNVKPEDESANGSSITLQVMKAMAEAEKQTGLDSVQVVRRELTAGKPPKDAQPENG